MLCSERTERNSATTVADDPLSTHSTTRSVSSSSSSSSTSQARACFAAAPRTSSPAADCNACCSFTSKGFYLGTTQSLHCTDGLPSQQPDCFVQEKTRKKVGKTVIFWYTKFEDEQSSNTYPQGWVKTKEKILRCSESLKNLFLGVDQAQKPINRPKRPEMSGSMCKWCF